MLTLPLPLVKGDGGEGHDAGGQGGGGGGGSTRGTVLSPNHTFVQSFLFLYHGPSSTLTFF
jgi:hypothetical protein